MVLVGVHLRDPIERGPKDARRIWQLHASACGLHDSLAAFEKTPKRYLSRTENSLARAGLKFEASSRGPFLHFILRGIGSAVGAITLHTDDILGCGEQDALPKVPHYLNHQLGESEVRGK